MKKLNEEKATGFEPMMARSANLLARVSATKTTGFELSAEADKDCGAIFRRGTKKPHHSTAHANSD